MTEWLEIAGWAVTCIGLWAAVARDPITVIFCAVVSVPFTVLFFLEHREKKALRTTR